MKWTRMIGLLAVLAVAASGVAMAQSEPTGIVKTRQEGMKSHGKAVKAIKDELAKSDPSIAVIKQNVAALQKTAPDIASWFPAGSGPESGMKTKALPAIWQKPDAFNQARMHYLAELKTFAAATDSGDLAKIKAEFPDLGKSCGGCHRNFRQKDD